MSVRVAGGGLRPLLAVIGFGVLLGAVVARFDGLLALALPAGAAVLVLVVLVRLLTSEDGPEEERRIMSWTMAAFGAHLFFGLLVTNTPGMRDYLGGDAATYHFYAVELLHHWTSSDPAPILPEGKEGFYYLLAALYRIFGVHWNAGVVVNAAAAAALVPLVTDTTRRAFGRDAARYIAPLMVLLPGMFMWTSQLLKEAGVLLFIAIAANCAGRILERVSVLPLVGVAVSVALLFTFRGWVALMVLGGLLLGVTLGRHRITAGIGTAFVTALLVSVLVLGFGLGSSGYNRAVNSNLERANAVRLDLAQSAQSGFAVERDISTPARALSYMPIGVTALTFGPFPWSVVGVRQLPALFDVAVWWLLLPSLWRGTTVARRRLGRGWLVFALPAGATAMLLALALGNYGTIVRERMQVVVLVAPLIAAGLAERARMRSAVAAQPEEEPERELEAVPA